MKKLVILPLLAIFISALILADTSISSPTTTTSKVWNLKFNDWAQPNIPWGKRNIIFADMIKERTNGRVNITWYWNETLSKMPDTWRNVQTGVADGSLYVYGINAGVHKLNTIYQLPFMGWSGVRGGAEIFLKMRKLYPELDEEFTSQGVTPFLWVVPMGNYDLHNATKDIIRVPTDLKGKKIMINALYADIIRSVGGAQLWYGPPDWYMALERGLAGVHAVHWAATEEQRTFELFKNHTILGSSGFATNFLGMVMNLKVWNSFPEDIKQIFREVSDEMLEITIKGLNKQHDDARKIAQDRNQEMIEITEQELALWEKWAEPVREKWISDMKASRWTNAREMLETALRLSKGK